MIALFTDFGRDGPYVGQMHAVLAREAPQVARVDLFHDASAYDMRSAAYLLPAYSACLPEGSVCLAIIDPGVGGQRRPVMLRADNRWYVGPDNGLFTLVERRARETECRVIGWRPNGLSASFHGRDLFAPVAARLARGEMPESRLDALTPPPGPPWPDDWARILYIDRFGNAVTGLRAGGLPRSAILAVGDRALKYARVFADVAEGEGFWYENANGLIEIAVNRGSAARVYGLKPGDAVQTD
jgi:hypothetical protein